MKDSRPLRCMIFRGSIPHPMQSLCTLRNRCCQRPRNTRYQADATPYLDRTFTGWIAPALRLAHLLDHLIGAGEERRWHNNAKRLGGFHIDDQLETSWLLDRQIGGLGAFEDFVGVHGSLV